MKPNPVAIALLVLLAFIGGCAGSTNFTPTGKYDYDPLPPNAQVRVFASVEDVKQPYDVIGIIEYSDAGKYQNVTLEDALPKLKKKARSVGANALIIDHSGQTKAGIFSSGIDTRVRAIRITDPSPSP